MCTASPSLIWLSLSESRYQLDLKAERFTICLCCSHNDYAPVRGSLRDSMLSFDTAVRMQRESIPVNLRDNSFRARIARTSVAQKASEPLRSSGRFLKSKLGPKQGGSFRRMQGSISNSFKLASESFKATRVGETVPALLMFSGPI